MTTAGNVVMLVLMLLAATGVHSALAMAQANSDHRPTQVWWMVVAAMNAVFGLFCLAILLSKHEPDE